jgi:hypothetical protein
VPISLLALNGLRVSEATGADIEHLDLERGHRTLTITRKGGKVVTIPLAPHTARAIHLAIGERTGGPVFLAADGAAAGPARHSHRRRLRRRRRPGRTRSSSLRELGEDLAQVVLDPARADEQPGPDLRVRQAVAGQPRNVDLLGGQLAGGLDGALASDPEFRSPTGRGRRHLPRLVAAPPGNSQTRLEPEAISVSYGCDVGAPVG